MKDSPKPKTKTSTSPVEVVPGKKRGMGSRAARNKGP